MTDAYRAAWAELGGGGVPEWVPALRSEGLRRFEATGFPTSRDEEWRFTPLGPLVQTPFAPATAPSRPITRGELEQFTYGHPEWPSLVFVNGRFAPELSTLAAPDRGLITSSLAQALVRTPELVEPHLARLAGPDATPFTALNAAFIQDGSFLRIPAGMAPDAPILLVFVTTPDQGGRMTHPRNLIVVEAGARVSLIENYVGAEDVVRGAGPPHSAPRTAHSAYFTNAVTEVLLGERAWVEHARIQREGDAAYHIASSHVHQDRESHYRSFTLFMGGAISRHNLHTRLDAPETEALLYGLSIAHRDQLMDNHTAIYHNQPDCRSWEVYKAILDGRSRGVFNGKVLVRPEAQKTDAKQTNRTLLLSEEARIDTKPQLEIFADDVKCTHGATVGYLDELPLFYARSRGIPAERATRLLTYAFAAEVLAEVAVDAVREELDRVVRERLGIPEGR